jgi:diguanylate cyclase (GGDEF)-like protein/hemerythrin-like metal-binding protein
MPSLGPETEHGNDTGLMSALVVNSDLIAVALGDHGHIRFANAAFNRLFRRHDGPTDASILDLLLPEHREGVAAVMRATTAQQPSCVGAAFRGEDGPVDVELRFQRVNHAGESLLAVAAQDITDRCRTQEQLNLLAYSDPLTSLANRAMFIDRLRQAALATRRTGHFFAVLMLDLDHFKAVNDSHGHAAGDYVLQRIALRMLACLRESDTVARLGGDEFAVLLPTLRRRSDAAVVADPLTKLAQQPIHYGKFELKVGASVGIAICPDHADTVDSLLAAADAALYAAKQQGRGCTVWATPASVADSAPEPLVWDAAHEVGVPEIDQQHAHLASLLNELANALRNGQEHAAIFREIVGYAVFHFGFEERLMQTCHYNGTAVHQGMHRRLMEDIRSLRLDESECPSVSLTLRYLQVWLLRHVDGADRDLAVALQKHDRS